MNEVLLLTSLVDARRHVLENKATQNDLELQDAQKSGWVVLCAEYNAHEECTTNRTVKQLSEKWDTLKTKAKGAQTAAHKELSKTGGGVPNQDSEIPVSTAPRGCPRGYWASAAKVGRGIPLTIIICRYGHFKTFATSCVFIFLG